MRFADALTGAEHDADPADEEAEEAEEAGSAPRAIEAVPGEDERGEVDDRSEHGYVSGTLLGTGADSTPTWATASDVDDEVAATSSAAGVDGPGDAGELVADPLALLDPDPPPGASSTGEVTSSGAVTATSLAGAAEDSEAAMRSARSSRWGRLDVGLAWRHRASEPLHAPPHRSDELWLVATWRR